MTLRLISSPPQLPYLLSGESFAKHLAGIDPHFGQQQEGLRHIATETDNYNRSRDQYGERNTHHTSWIQWSNNNPAGTEQLLTFLKDHRAHFDAACGTLAKIEAALAGFAEIANIDDLQAQIRQMRERADTDARLLAGNIEVIGAPTPADADASKNKILPRRRPRPASTPT